jgi:hypothetical protein
MRRTFFAGLIVLLCCGAVFAQAPQPDGQAPPGARGGRGGGRGGQAAPAPRIVNFEARPSSVKPGESVTLVWSTENPAGTNIDPDVGAVTARGTKLVKPAETTTYTLTLGGRGGTPVTKSVTVTVAGTTPRSVGSAANQTSAARGIPRMADGKPDFTGVYGFGGAGGRGGRGAPADAAGGLPRTPTLKPGADKYKVVREALDVGRTADCMPLPPTEAFGVPYPFQIVQNKDYVIFLHEYPGTFRIIPLDGQPHPDDPDPTWMGDSVGRWEGDTLVIDTVGYNEKTVVSGYHHSDALHTVERLTRTEDGFTYEVTLEDPNVFVGPWMETRSYRLASPPQRKVMEFVCENNRDYKPLFGATSKQPGR